MLKKLKKIFSIVHKRVLRTRSQKLCTTLNRMSDKTSFSLIYMAASSNWLRQRPFKPQSRDSSSRAVTTELLRVQSLRDRSTRLKTLYDKSWSGSKHKEILSYYIYDRQCVSSRTIYNTPKIATVGVEFMRSVQQQQLEASQLLVHRIQRLKWDCIMRKML